MDMKKFRIRSSDQAPDKVDMIKETLEDFNQAIHSLSETRKTLERDVTFLREEMDSLKKERSVLEMDVTTAQDASEVAMTAKAAEEEKQDALIRNQELKSYLDSAAGTIKDLEMKLIEKDREIKRMNSRVESLEKEKASLMNEREDLKTNMFRVRDMLKEQDLKIKSLTINLESSEDDRKFLTSELESTRQALDDIQKAMLSIKEKMRKGYLQELPQTS